VAIYLFQCGDHPIFAISVDQDGTNIPRRGVIPWQFRSELLPAEQERHIPEARETFEALGYCLLDEEESKRLVR
jgi:hypothetical protein